MIIDENNVKYFVNTDSKYRRVHPDNREYRIFMRHKVEKGVGDEPDAIIPEEIEFGIGEFFYGRDGIESYSEKIPKLQKLPLDELILELERLEIALNKPVLVIEKIPTKDGQIKVINQERWWDFKKRREEEIRKAKLDKKRKEEKEKHE